jgi:hypothetical protein
VTGAGETERHFWSKVYEQQLSLVEKNKTDELTDSHYQEDAALVSFQKIVCGGQALREYLREYRKVHGRLQVLSLDFSLKLGFVTRLCGGKAGLCSISLERSDL